MKQPLSILYPLGDKVYNIAVTNPLLVTHMDRFSF